MDYVDVFQIFKFGLEIFAILHHECGCNTKFPQEIALY